MYDPSADLLLPLPASLREDPPDPVLLERQVVELFDDFRDRLLRYALSLGLPVHDGEEIIQEVFLALFKHLRLGKPDHNLQGWIFRVTHNLALKQRHANHKMENGREHDSLIAKRCRDTNPNPEEQIIFGQKQQTLRAILSELPERDRWCLYLRSEGLRYREIAAALDMSLGAVSNSIARSVVRLSKANGD